MKIVDRYILKELTGPFIFGVAVFSAILVSGFILPQLFSLFEEGITLSDAVLLFIYSLPRYLVHTLAMAALLGVLMGFGRLSAESETVALHAAGASLGRLAVPGVIFGILVSLLSLFMGQRVIPYTNRAADTLMMQIKRGQKEARKGILIQNKSDGTRQTINATRFNPSSGLMRQVTITLFDRNNAPTSVIYAEEARYDEKKREWRGYRVRNIVFSRDLPPMISNFREQMISDIAPPEDLATRSKRATEMTNEELRRQATLLRNQDENTAGQKLNADLLEVEYYRRIALPFACLVFTLIGTPLGMRSHRRSSSIGVGLTLIIVFAYFIVSQWLGIIGESGVLKPIVAVWLPNIFFAIAGIILIATARK